MLGLMQELGVDCINAYEKAREDPIRRLDSWELKSFAITYSRFEEVLYIDADNVAVQNPEFLFDQPEYLETGAVFWPDRYLGPGSGQEWLKRDAWSICRVTYSLEPEIEAGQLLINKKKCWRPLMIALHLNEHSDFYYGYFYGDKDTFHLAWRRAQFPFALVPHGIRNLGDSDVIVQHDFNGRILFQHRNGDKWNLNREPKHVAGFLEEDSCREFLNQLKSRWQPPVRRLPDQFTTIERAAYQELCEHRDFLYQQDDDSGRKLELRSDFRIGAGAAMMEVSWMIEEDKDGQPVLSIRNANAPTCFLRRSPTGSWIGRWLVYDRQQVKLTPMIALARKESDFLEQAL
jgi:hypothetical protein